MKQTDKALGLRRAIADLKPKLQGMLDELAQIERSCLHDWTEPAHKPIHHEGYHFAGDPPGTMGIDRQLPFDVPAKTVDRWVRTCKVCGKLEETTNTEVAEIRRKPVF